MEADHPLAAAYERYGPQLRRYLWRRSADPHAVDDLLHQTFVEALRTWDRYEDRGFPISSWLFAIARSRLADHRRRAQRQSVEQTIAEWHARVADSAVQAEADDERAQIWAAVARLPDRQRLVIELRFKAEWEIARVAALLCASEGAVKGLQHRAMANLAQLLGAAPAQETSALCRLSDCYAPMHARQLCVRHYRAQARAEAKRAV